MLTIKEHFKHLMLEMYPFGVSAILRRDLIRTFVCGYAAALRVEGRPEAARLILDDVRLIIEASWMPDSSWNWELKKGTN